MTRAPWQLSLALGLGIASLLLTLFACSDGGPRPSDGSEFPKEWPRPKYEKGTLKIKGKELTVEIADSPELRRYGFMFVTTPPKDDEGMIFIYPTPRTLSFWMRNTRIPLDILFVGDDGKIINAHRNMVPLDETRSYPALRECRYAIELRAGWLEDHGAWIGDPVELSDALRARSGQEDPPVLLENIPRYAAK